MQFMEKTVPQSWNHMKATNTTCRQNPAYLSVKLDGSYNFYSYYSLMLKPLIYKPPHKW